MVGAVTHVFVQDSTKGYGIFLENMLEAAERWKIMKNQVTYKKYYAKMLVDQDRSRSPDMKSDTILGLGTLLRILQNRAYL